MLCDSVINRSRGSGREGKPKLLIVTKDLGNLGSPRLPLSFWKRVTNVEKKERSDPLSTVLYFTLFMYSFFFFFWQLKKNKWKEDERTELKDRPSPNFGYSRELKTLNPQCWGWGGVGVGEVRGFLNCLHGKKRQPTLVKGIHPLHQSNHDGHHKQMVVTPKKITCISAFWN